MIRLDGQLLLAKFEICLFNFFASIVSLKPLNQRSVDFFPLDTPAPIHSVAHILNLIGHHTGRVSHLHFQDDLFVKQTLVHLGQYAVRHLRIAILRSSLFHFLKFLCWAPQHRIAKVTIEADVELT